MVRTVQRFLRIQLTTPTRPDSVIPMSHDYLEHIPTLAESINGKTMVDITVSPNFVTLRGQVLRFESPDGPYATEPDGTDVYELNGRTCILLDTGEIVRLQDMVEVIGV